jgi:hypothetical protein
MMRLRRKKDWLYYVSSLKLYLDSLPLFQGGQAFEGMAGRVSEAISIKVLAIAAYCLRLMAKTCSIPCVIPEKSEIQ